MSRCEVYYMNAEGEIRHYASARNAWNGAMKIWTKLADKYGVTVGLLEGFQPLWDMFTDDKMSLYDKWVLGSTFDGVVVQKDDIKTLVESLKSFVNDHGSTETLLREIQILEEAAEDNAVYGVAFNQTDVSKFTLDGYEIQIEGTDVYEFLAYNVNTDKKHWYLGDELNGKDGRG